MALFSIFCLICRERSTSVESFEFMSWTVNAFISTYLSFLSESPLIFMICCLLTSVFCILFVSYYTNKCRFNNEKPRFSAKNDNDFSPAVLFCFAKHRGSHLSVQRAEFSVQEQHVFARSIATRQSSINTKYSKILTFPINI